MTIDIDAIRKREQAATEGPWFYDSHSGVFSTPKVAARTDVPALCDEIERLRAELAEILAMAERFDTPRDSGRVRVFVGDLRHMAHRALTGPAR